MPTTQSEFRSQLGNQSEAMRLTDIDRLMFLSAIELRDGTIWDCGDTAEREQTGTKSATGFTEVTPANGQIAGGCLSANTSQFPLILIADVWLETECPN